MQPLSQRVPDLGQAGTPAPVDGIHWRAATADDVDAVYELATASAAKDHPHVTPSREEVGSGFTVSWIDIEADGMLGFAGDLLVAAGLVNLPPGQDTQRRVQLTCNVHPGHRGRGIGRALLQWQQRRGTERLRALDTAVPGVLEAWALEANIDRVGLLEASGFEIARWFSELRRNLADPVAERDLDGYRIVTLTPEWHEPARLARNDSFRDHWGSQPKTEEHWRLFVQGATLRPELSHLAIAENGEVAGFVLTEHNPEDAKAAGFTSAYIALVGVTRAHRRRGIAPALLSHTLLAAQRAGLEYAVLDVDSASPTGADGLYASLGFAPDHHEMSLTRQW